MTSNSTAATFDRTLNRLHDLDASTLAPSGAWEAARIFDHLAQGVEFSMVGYPVLKPRIFRSTLGALAFHVFQWRGRMSHGLDQDIPGEIIAPANADPEQARQRLLSALDRFDAFDHTLCPHFAYGNLTKAQYARAHVFHIENHLEECDIA